MGQVTVFSGPERRRRWSDEERREILTEAFSPGACVGHVWWRHDISSALIYTWRRKLRDAQAQTLPEAVPGPVFAQAVMDEDTAARDRTQHPAIIVELARGKRLSIFGSASPTQVAAALRALR
ncbi:transposase [Erythrobacter sp. QSSC1-22B]|uniref:IS66-like element accessory protein TnpA n=1 Tax=Erythrobacter sp. QSSC1-22B TaxID=1860125 RepID=UPI0008053D52|nr:transposase [Erythrobacter sp. QSSC1-22B]OBX17510.1 transposase [Erythrobacter sp. QSSC1-22B]